MSVIEKELERAKNATLPKESDILKETKLLLDGDSAKEAEILKNLGLGDQILAAEHERGLQIEFNKIAERFSEEFAIISLKEMKNIAIKYRLFIKNSTAYAGVIPPDLGRLLVRANEKHSLQLDLSTASGKMFIMAPPSMFKDYRNPLQKVGDIVTEMKKESIRRKEEHAERVARLKAAREADPVLFLVQGDYCIIIKKWGKDFTPARRVLGAITNNNFLAKAAITSVLAALVLLVGLAIKAIIVNPWIYGKNIVFDKVTYTDGTSETIYNAGFLGILGVLACIVLCIISANFLVNTIKFFTGRGKKYIDHFKTTANIHI